MDQRTELADDLMSMLASMVPEALSSASGRVFYSGREAFSGRREIYVLGANPGGDPATHPLTIDDDVRMVSAMTAPWSAYIDDRWLGLPAGTQTLQRRVRHLLDGLDLDPRLTPSSNLVFVRSIGTDLLDDQHRLADLCWPVHKHAIGTLGVRAVICFGGFARDFIVAKLGGGALIDRAVETNRRGWESTAYRCPGDLVLIGLPHPSRANFLSMATDPVPFVKRVLADTRIRRTIKAD